MSSHASCRSNLDRPRNTYFDKFVDVNVDVDGLLKARDFEDTT